MTIKKFFAGKAAGFGIVLALVVLVGAFAALKSVGDQKANGLIVGKTVAVSGNVLALDSSQIAFDGPYVLTLRSEEGISFTVKLPSMGLPLCPAYKSTNIGDVSLMKAGMAIEVNGKVGEDGSIVPCESSSHYLRSKGMVENFEGEADPSRMMLGMKRWSWISAQYNDGRTIRPANASKFTLIFGPDSRFSATTDCNSIAGTYAVEDSSKTLSFVGIYSTKMFCEGSQESDFTKLLETTGGYHFTSRGELILDLKFDSGSAVFR